MSERKRTRHGYIVLREVEVNQEKQLVLAIVANGFTDSGAAQRWLRQKGMSGENYIIGCLIGEPVRVQVTPVEKRRLVSGLKENA